MISVVICTYNRCDLLERTLNSFHQQSCLADVDYELLVIDNNSADDTRKVAERFAEKHSVRYVFEDRQGHSFARNRGLSESRGEIVAYLDDDVLLDENWLQNLQKCFDETGADAVGGRSYLVIEGDRPDWLGAEFRLLLSEVELGAERKRLPEGQGLYGLNLSFRKKALEEVGGFDVTLGRRGAGLMGSEETTALVNIARAGGTIYYDPDASLGHIIQDDRLSWDYFERLANSIGRSLAASQPPASFLVRLLRCGRSLIAVLRTTLTLWFCTIFAASPYRQRQAQRKRITASSRLKEYLKKI